MKYNKLITAITAMAVALLFAATAGLNGISAQSPVDYDADDDGLIEIEWLGQLDAVRWDLDFDELRGATAGTRRGDFAEVPGLAAEYMGCADQLFISRVAELLNTGALKYYSCNP